MLTRIVTLFAAVSVIYAMKCYNGPGSLDNNSPVQTIDCAYGVTTCMKVVTFATRQWTKQCGSINSNCTQGGYQTTNPVCENTTTLSMTCCCFGDSCNSAPTSSLFFAGAVTAISLAIF